VRPSKKISSCRYFICRFQFGDF